MRGPSTLLAGRDSVLGRPIAMCLDLGMNIQEKLIFFTVYIHISKDRNSLKNCSFDQIFFLQVQEIPMKFFCSLGPIIF